MPDDVEDDRRRGRAAAEAAEVVVGRPVVEDVKGFEIGGPGRHDDVADIRESASWREPLGGNPVVTLGVTDEAIF